MESIREVDDECGPSNEGTVEQICEHSPSTPTEDLLKMAASVQDVLWGAGGGSGENLSKSPLVRRARKLLYRRFRVGVEDGRIFVGKFHCLDKQGNIILYDTMEYRQISGLSADSSDANAKAAGVEQRNLGLVLIPARCRTSCFVECSVHEQQSLLSVNDGSIHEQLSHLSVED